MARNFTGLRKRLGVRDDSPARIASAVLTTALSDAARIADVLAGKLLTGEDGVQSSRFAVLDAIDFLSNEKRLSPWITLAGLTPVEFACIFHDYNIQWTKSQEADLRKAFE